MRNKSGRLHKVACIDVGELYIDSGKICQDSYSGMMSSKVALMPQRTESGTALTRQPQASNVLYYLHSDHPPSAPPSLRLGHGVGSTSLTTDASGSVVARQLYDAWGNVRVKGDLKTDITFTGQRSNLDQIGLYYFKARFYASSLGRFVSADTLVPSASDPQQQNRYAYGLNNPVKNIDPSGHAVTCGTADGGCDTNYLPHPAGPTAPPGAVNNAWNFATSVAVALGTAFLGGGLIGAGSNLIRTAFATGNTTTGLIGSGLVGAGTGVLVGDSTTVAQAALSGKSLDPSDILINSTTTGGAGFVSGIIPGFGGSAMGLRALLNGLYAAIASEMSDIAHGRPVNVEKAVLSGGSSALLGAAADKLGSIMNRAPSTPLNTPMPYWSLATFVADRKADNALGFGIVNAFTIQGPLYLFGALTVNNQK